VRPGYACRADPAAAYREVHLPPLQTAFPQPEVPIFEPFVDEHAIAEFLHLAPRRVLEMARRGELPAHPIGRIRMTWRFRLSEIEAHFTGGAESQRDAKIALAVPGTQGRKRLG
jgi:hypothetical protein